LDLLESVISKGIRVELIDRPDFAWKGGDSFAEIPNRYIRISTLGYQHYGWEVMTSVLVHEFGHCDLFLEGISETPGMSYEDKIRLEVLTNERGEKITPPHLIPADYHAHREFFLRAYCEHGWTEEKTLTEWASFQDAL